MSPQEFKNHWATGPEPLVPIDKSKLTHLGLNATTIEFLNIAGLPRGAAPFLSFATESKRISSYGHQLTELYDFLPPSFSRYVSIGFDGSGNPIAIDAQDDDKIVWLDHEDGFTPAYMNSSIGALATFLQGYRDFVQDLLNAKGEDAFLKGDYEDSELEKLRQELVLVDPHALELNNFWNQELATLKANQGSR